MEVEDARRSRLQRAERLGEQEQELQRYLEDNPTTTLLLQPSPPRHMSRAQCYNPSCPHEHSQRRPGYTITDDYRVFIDSSDHECYHVSCLEDMLDLARLALTQFNLDNHRYRWNGNSSWPWGLMFQKWVEHSGRVKLDKIAEYFEELDAYSEARDEMSTRFIE
ncbi:hypothetical protein AUP68_10501 [Ilyonectria robusta]